MGLGSGIRKKPIRDPGSRIKKAPTRSRIQICNTEIFEMQIKQLLFQIIFVCNLFFPSAVSDDINIQKV